MTKIIYPSNWFRVPSFQLQEDIKEGDFVKISNNKDRFWVKVTEIFPDNIVGIVNNNLTCKVGYNLGDEITFKKEHILDYLSGGKNDH